MAHDQCHKETNVYCPWKGQEVPIDEGIAELIKEVWRLGMRTTTCCEDTSRGRRPMWIDFECDSFLLFAKAITEVIGVEWHITPRPNPLNKEKVVIGVSFPSTYYDRILSFFRNEGG